MPIPIPPLGVQDGRLALIRAARDSIRELSTAIERASRRCDSTKRSLLVAAFTGCLTGVRSDMDQVEELAGV